MSPPPRHDPPPDDRYYILVGSPGADLPKLVLKHADSFLVADQHGDFSGSGQTEFGLYVDGTRFLSQLELRVHESRPLLLNAALSEDTLQLGVDLTNPDVLRSGRVVLPGQTIRIARLLTLYGNQLYQTLRVESFAHEPHDLPLTWRFASDFVDVFEVRGFGRASRGSVLAPRYENGLSQLAYRGLDQVVRSTYLAFDPPPTVLADGAALYRLSLVPGASVELSLVITAAVEPGPAPKSLRLVEVMTRRRGGRDRLASDATKIDTGNEQFSRWIERSRTDLHMLLTETPDGVVPYAGIPWYVCPFGRDSLITAMQVLPFEPDIARGTLKFLARHQGTVDDDFTDQQPGKILHEYRRGELAACREIPFIPYYGSVDATPLYIMLLAEYIRWTADWKLAKELWPTVERALAWIMGPGSPDGDDYLKYSRRSPDGLGNQGWKDSRDAVMHASGMLAATPIALVEVQGYQYAALMGAAAIAEAIGSREAAPGFREHARRLREHFEHDFWMEGVDFYALALDGDRQACRVVSSNPGHCLWTGIVGEGRARAIATRLMAEDMFSGWGIRTLSTVERLYNPMSYHNGSVWPHDTAIAAVGLRAYGFTDEFLAVTTALFQTALQMDGMRMPELLCGFSRLQGYGPTRYPVACSPQAWAAGVVFHLVAGMIGLVPDSRENRITLDRPVLPPWLSSIELRGLRLGASRFDLIVSRGRRVPTVELLARHGDAEVVVRR